MYLFAFVILFMAAVGVYAQAYFIQAAKVFEKQTAIAQMMVMWNNAAAQDTMNFPAPASGSNTCLAQPFGTRPTAFAVGGAFGGAPAWSTVKCSLPGTPPQNLTITWVSPPTGGTSATPLANYGFSIAEIMQQMQNVTMVTGTYGMATAVVGPNVNILTNNDPVQLPIPTSSGIVVGSMVVVARQ